MFLTKADRIVTAATSSTICPCTEVRCGATFVRAASITPERATAALTTSAGHDDDDVVAEAGKGLAVGHDSGEHRGQQGENRHQIVAQPAPEEENHGRGKDGEGKGLIESHRTTIGQRPKG